MNILTRANATLLNSIGLDYYFNPAQTMRDTFENWVSDYPKKDNPAFKDITIEQVCEFLEPADCKTDKSDDVCICLLNEAMVKIHLEEVEPTDLSEFIEERIQKHLYGSRLFESAVANLLDDMMNEEDADALEYFDKETLEGICTYD